MFQTHIHDDSVGLRNGNISLRCNSFDCRGEKWVWEKRTLSFVPSTSRKPKSGVQLRASFGAPLDRLNAGNSQHFCSKILVQKLFATFMAQF